MLFWDSNEVSAIHPSLIRNQRVSLSHREHKEWKLHITNVQEVCPNFFSCFCQTCCCQTPLRYCKSYQKIISTNEELISGRSGLVHVSTEHGSHAQSEGLYWSSRWLRYSKTPNFVDSLKFSFTNRTDGYFISVPPSIVDTRSSTDLVVREKEKVEHITHQPSYIANDWYILTEGEGEWSEVPIFGDIKL